MRCERIQWLAALTLSLLGHLVGLAAVGQWLVRAVTPPLSAVPPALSVTAIVFEEPPPLPASPSPAEPIVPPEPPQPSTMPPPPLSPEREESLPLPEHIATPVETSEAALETPAPLLTEPDSPFLAAAPPVSIEPSPASAETERPTPLPSEMANGRPDRPSVASEPAEGEAPMRSTEESDLLLTAIRPRYPLGSRLRGEEGLVVVRAYLSPAGIVRDVDIAKSSGYPALDEAARRAVRSARFRPFVPHNESETERVVELRIRFVLKDP
jgi:protein TonB